MTKDEMRKTFMSKRDELSLEQIEEKSRSICGIVTEMADYREAKALLIYASMKSEVMTDDIILDALSLGKKVFCPKVTDKNMGIMEFIRIYGLEDLKAGFYGIREPFGDEDKEVYNDSMLSECLMIMPGVAFDKKGGRIGYKGGFYDRFLEKRTDMNRLAISFDCQISKETIPVTSQDINVPKVVTESGVL
ncbi:MAG: 5-formyltetrahydrofolate cyclo-ligase [Butyrivibrio sp.]|nr:5-formyltetrahydrofolate cyclo-ligase [Butyrivibrio sp.]